MSAAPWPMAQLGDVCRVIRGITFPASAKEASASASNVCCLRTTNIQREVDWGDVYFVPREFVKREEQLVRVGDVLMSMANSYELVGKVAIAREVPQPAAFGAFLAAIRPSEAIEVRFLFHWLRTSDIQRELREGSSQTTNIANISISRLAKLRIPVPPLSEQKRIADKLDRLLAAVDTCKARLDAIPDILKRFRQSVLAAAVSGELTEEWREYECNAGAGRSEAQLRMGWRRAVLRDCISEMVGGASPSSSDYVAEGVLVLNKGDIKQHGVVALKVRQNRIPSSYAAKHPKKIARPGDILLTLRDLSTKADFLGLIAKYTGSEVAVITQGMFILRVTRQLLSDYLVMFSNSPSYRAAVKRQKVGATQVHLRNDQFLQIALSLPPISEQHEIVRRVQRLFAYANDAERAVDAVNRRLEVLTVRMLSSAFRGELCADVPK